MASATTTPVDVCNLALLYTGTGQTINSLDENTQEAKACKVFYAKARDALLESFWWKFATKHAVLALLAGQARTDWVYTYALPADCITPRYIHTGMRIPNAIDKIPFDIETVSSAADLVSGLCLVCDQQAAQLCYTANSEVVALWSPLFIEALAWELATRLCLILPVKPEWSTRAKAGAIAAFAKAGAAQNRGAQQDPNPPSEYTSAR